MNEERLEADLLHLGDACSNYANVFLLDASWVTPPVQKKCRVVLRRLGLGYLYFGGYRRTMDALEWLSTKMDAEADCTRRAKLFKDFLKDAYPSLNERRATHGCAGERWQDQPIPGSRQYTTNGPLTNQAATRPAGDASTQREQKGGPGPYGLLFTNEVDVLFLQGVLQLVALSAPYSIPPSDTRLHYDLVIPAGPTRLNPTQTSFFAALGIPTKIRMGVIEILKEVNIAKKGEILSKSAASLAKSLGVYLPSPHMRIRSGVCCAPKSTLDSSRLYAVGRVRDIYTEADVRSILTFGDSHLEIMANTVNASLLLEEDDEAEAESSHLCGRLEEVIPRYGDLMAETNFRTCIESLHFIGVTLVGDDEQKSCDSLLSSIDIIYSLREALENLAAISVEIGIGTGTALDAPLFSQKEGASPYTFTLDEVAASYRAAVGPLPSKTPATTRQKLCDCGDGYESEPDWGSLFDT